MTIAFGFWLFILGLWWAIAHTGVKGTSPLLAILGILAIPLLFKRLPGLSLDVLMFILFILWAVFTSLWSAGAAGQVLTVDVANGIYALEAPSVRIALSALVCGYAYWSLHHVKLHKYGSAVWAARIGLGIQAILFLAWIFLWDLVLAYGRSQSSDYHLEQNLIRIVNISVVMVPLFVALIPVKSALAKGAVFIIAMTGMAVLARREGIDSLAAQLSIIGVSGAVLMGLLLGRQIYRVLGYITAGLILTMPGLAYGALRFLKTARDSLPLSAQARLDSYAYVLDKIRQKIFLGWGIDASKSWDETHLITLPDGRMVDYAIVPGHPHNAALHVWAETGVVGAFLLALFAAFLGERLARTSSRSREIASTGAGIWVGALVLALLSYSLWNDAFWASIVISASGVLALSRKRIHSRRGWV